MISNEKMILAANEPFAIGGRRECFIVPGNESRCVKVYGVNGWPRERRQKAPWYKKLRPLYFFDDNRREYASFKALAKHSSDVWRHFPRCYGLVETDRGLGIVTDLIRNDDGSIARSLEDYVREHGKSDAITAALEEFYHFLLSDVVITRDLLIHNLIVKEAESRLTIVMIDGFGSTEIIPVSSLFKSIGRKKVARKIQRFKARYNI